MERVVMKITAGVGLVYLVISGAMVPADSGENQPLSIQWAQSTPFPEPTAGYAAGVLHRELVVSGGTYWLGTKDRWVKKIFSEATYSFHPTTLRWNKLPDALIPLGYAASTVVANKLYVMGGYTGEKVNREIYTLQNNHNQYIWKTFGELPVDRVFATAVPVGENIYLVGGATMFEPTDALGTCCTSSTATNSLMVLDTKHPGQGWRELAPFPGAKRLFFTAETDGDSIWVFGGQYQASPKDSVVNFDEVLRYNPGRGEWKLMGHLPEALKSRPFVSPIYAGKRMVLISSITKVWELDLQTLKFRELTPLPKEAFVDKFVWLGGHLIGSGGENTEDPPRRRSDWTFIGEFLHD